MAEKGAGSVGGRGGGGGGRGGGGEGGGGGGGRGEGPHAGETELAAQESSNDRSESMSRA